MGVKARTIAFLIAFSATPLLANNPPAPQMALAMVSMLPSMAILTALGGGYAVLRRMNERLGEDASGRMEFVAKAIGVIVVIVLGGSSEGATTLAFLVFLVAAIVRATHMLQWAWRAKNADPDAPQYGVNRVRMTTFAILIIVVGGFFLSVMVAFAAAWDLGNEYRYPAMRKYVAYRLALRTPPSPQRAALEKEAEKNLEYYRDSMSGIHERKVRIDENGQHFAVYLLPNVGRFPFRPYDRTFSAPTYRADDTGAIRMKYAQSFEWCPPNAPIVDRVTADDVRQVLAGKTIIDDLSPAAAAHARGHHGHYGHG